MVDLDDLSVYGYELERLLKIKHQCDEICAWFLNEKGSIRMCAKNVCMSKSLVHKYIHTSRSIMMKNINKFYKS